MYTYINIYIYMHKHESPPLPLVIRGTLLKKRAYYESRRSTPPPR
jgi:hypothetical protein